MTPCNKELAMMRCLNKIGREGIAPVFINCLEDTSRFHPLGPCVFEINTFGYSLLPKVPSRTGF